jgi:hypothetical protein
MTLESRIERLEANLKRTEETTQQTHLLIVHDCIVGDEAHNEAQKRKALAA